MHGGDWVAEVLRAQGVSFVFTLTGGHIAPILVGAKERGIRVVDVRHEATAVFAADAVARLSGVVGVAAVTAGPGVTNTLTAIKNAQLAQSPIVLLGGAAATSLQGRGALQDIDQISLFKTAVKWSKSVRRVNNIVSTLERAFLEARSGVPGPVFVELPIDILYPEDIVRRLYQMPLGHSLMSKLIALYLRWHLDRLFRGASRQQTAGLIRPKLPQLDGRAVDRVVQRLLCAERPLILIGAQAVLDVKSSAALATAVEQIGVPTYLSSMARGLLGKNHPLQMRHKRRETLKQADFILLAGVPCDFRLEYGNVFRRSSYLVSVNLSAVDLRRNRRPDIGLRNDPGQFLRAMGEQIADKRDNDPDHQWDKWIATLRAREESRLAEIANMAMEPANLINPLYLCQELESVTDSNTILVADGGDFVATASYVVQPPGPLRWLDPGPFGTLGVGAGFALGAKLVSPEADVWVIYGDGSLGYSLSEFDTFVRHQVPIIALIGNDASWSQIAREQIEIFNDPVATTLAHTDYHIVAEGLGGVGQLLSDPELVGETLQNARHIVSSGKPLLINALLAQSNFRNGSISV